MLLGTADLTRVYFSDTFQRVRALAQFGRDQMIVRAGVFDLPEIAGFVLPESYATSVYLAGVGQFGYPQVSGSLNLSNPIPLPHPGAMAGIGALGLVAARRRR